jgi:hypothetical protein
LPQNPVRTRQELNNNRQERPQANKSQLQKNSDLTVSYSQAIAGPPKPKVNSQPNNEQNGTLDQTLQLILDKLNKQEQMFTKFEERLTRLEYSAKGAIPKQK